MKFSQKLKIFCSNKFSSLKTKLSTAYNSSSDAIKADIDLAQDTAKTFYHAAKSFSNLLMTGEKAVEAAVNTLLAIGNLTICTIKSLTFQDCSSNWNKTKDALSNISKNFNDANVYLKDSGNAAYDTAIDISKLPSDAYNFAANNAIACRDNISCLVDVTQLTAAGIAIPVMTASEQAYYVTNSLAQLTGVSAIHNEPDL